MLARVFPVPLYGEKGDWAGISGAPGTPWYPGNVVESFGSCAYKSDEHAWTQRRHGESYIEPHWGCGCLTGSHR